MTIGDLGEYFTPFEEDLVLKRSTEKTIDSEGYMTKNKVADIKFRGLISPHQSAKRFETEFDASSLGAKWTGDAVLYVRLGQCVDRVSLPEIKIEDFIYEVNTQITWKVVKAMDYSQPGNVRIYELVKVRPDA